MLNWIKALITGYNSPDPVRECDVYLTTGCPHVDGFLCDFPQCDILSNHREQLQNSRMFPCKKLTSSQML